jgi:hypothetical protein
MPLVRKWCLDAVVPHGLRVHHVMVPLIDASKWACKLCEGCFMLPVSVSGMPMQGSPLARPFGVFVERARVNVLGLVPSIAKAWRASDCMRASAFFIALSRTKIAHCNAHFLCTEDLLMVNINF